MGLWMMSTSHKSPLSNNHEVSGAKVADIAELTDQFEWEVVTEDGLDWSTGQPVALKNVFSGYYLQTHQHAYGRPIAHHLEVVAVPNRTAFTRWRVPQGVLFQGVTGGGREGGRAGTVRDLEEGEEVRSHAEL